jgi:hypothetical protein
MLHAFRRRHPRPKAPVSEQEPLIKNSSMVVHRCSFVTRSAFRRMRHTKRQNRFRSRQMMKYQYQAPLTTGIARNTAKNHTLQKTAQLFAKANVRTLGRWRTLLAQKASRYSFRIDHEYLRHVLPCIRKGTN